MAEKEEEEEEEKGTVLAAQVDCSKRQLNVS